MVDKKLIGLIGDVLLDKETKTKLIVLSNNYHPTSSSYKINVYNVSDKSQIDNISFSYDYHRGQTDLLQRYELLFRLNEPKYWALDVGERKRKVFLRDAPDLAPKPYWVLEYRLVIHDIQDTEGDMNNIDYSYLYKISPYRNAAPAYEYSSGIFEAWEEDIDNRIVNIPFNPVENINISDMKPDMYFMVHYTYVEILMKKCFDIDIDAVEMFGATNDSYHIIDTQSVLYDFDYRNLNKLFSKSNNEDSDVFYDDTDEPGKHDLPDLINLFSYAARLGLIPHGKYLVNVSW